MLNKRPPEFLRKSAKPICRSVSAQTEGFLRFLNFLQNKPDPPYNLSNDGFTCKGGRMVSVNKGDWDVSRGPEADFEFHREWIAACHRKLKPGGTIWISGTYHSIYHLYVPVALRAPRLLASLPCKSGAGTSLMTLAGLSRMRPPICRAVCLRLAKKATLRLPVVAYAPPRLL